MQSPGQLNGAEESMERAERALRNGDLNGATDPVNQAAWNKFFPGYYMTHMDIEYGPESREKQDPTSLDKSFRNWVLTPWKELARVRPTWLEMWTKEIGA